MTSARGPRVNGALRGLQGNNERVVYRCLASVNTLLTDGRKRHPGFLSKQRKSLVWVWAEARITLKLVPFRQGVPSKGHVEAASLHRTGSTQPREVTLAARFLLGATPTLATADRNAHMKTHHVVSGFLQDSRARARLQLPYYPPELHAPRAGCQ